MSDITGTGRDAADDAAGAGGAMGAFGGGGAHGAPRGRHAAPDAPTERWTDAAAEAPTAPPTPADPTPGAAAGAPPAAPDAPEAAARATARDAGFPRPARPGPAHLEIRRVDVWSVLRISSAVSVIWFLVWMIALAILYGGLQVMGVFSSIGELVGGVEALTFGTVLAGGAALGLLWAILGVLLSVVGAAIFNACSGLVGGVGVEVERA